VAKICDFGASKNIRGFRDTRPPSFLRSKSVDLTTYVYMAEDQSGLSADIYSLGCIMFRMCTLKFPFVSRNGARMAYQNIQTERKRQWAANETSKKWEVKLGSQSTWETDTREKFEHLINWMMHPDEKYRMKLDEFWTSPAVLSVVDDPQHFRESLLRGDPETCCDEATRTMIRSIVEENLRELKPDRGGVSLEA